MAASRTTAYSSGGKCPGAKIVGAGVVNPPSSWPGPPDVAEALQHPREVARAAVHVLNGVPRVVHAQALGRRGHQLHEPHGAGVALGVGVHAALGEADGLDELRLDPVLGLEREQLVVPVVEQREGAGVDLGRRGERLPLEDETLEAGVGRRVGEDEAAVGQLGLIDVGAERRCDEGGPDHPAKGSGSRPAPQGMLGAGVLMLR